MPALISLKRVLMGSLTAAGVIGSLLAGGCKDSTPPVGPDTLPDTDTTIDTTTTPPPPPPPPPPAVMLAAGDIADCGLAHDSLTALLIDAVPDSSAQGWPVVVAALGDLAYPDGTDAQFGDCYGPTWGRHRYRTRPAIGNHEYNTPNAQGYWNYFGLRAGPEGKGWYSYDVGRWHVVVLNSNWRSPARVGTGPTSEQMEWLRNDLAASTRQCQVAYFHHPRYSSSARGADSGMAHAWRILYQYGVELVLAGHEHYYERFAPMDGEGNRDDEYGIRQIISGMAGTHNGGTSFGTIHPLSEERQNSTTGVLKLTLDSTFYSWEFLAVPGRGDFTDSGRADCHGPRPMGTAEILGRAGRRLLGTVQHAQRPVPLLWPDAHERALRRSTSD